MSRLFKLAQIQSRVYPDLQKNLDVLALTLETLAHTKTDMVCLGEMFCCPYETPAFPVYAIEENDAVYRALSDFAKKYGVYLSAGTVPERGDDGHIYNTAYVFDRSGHQIAKHRKVHLFDVNIKGGQSFCESEILSAGSCHTVFDTEFGRMGVCICFDCRFPEMVRAMVLEGAQLILVPAAFNMTTGPAHWDVMFRSRAIDNQCFMVGTSPARDMTASYHAWGHSLVVSPWGDVLKEAKETECIQITDIDLSYVEEIRAQLPLLASFQETSSIVEII